MGGSFLYLLGTSQGRSATRKRAYPRRDYDASVRVARYGHGAEGGRAGSRHGVPKTETKVCGRVGYSVEVFIRSLGREDTWVRVPVLHGV